MLRPGWIQSRGGHHDWHHYLVVGGDRAGRKWVEALVQEGRARHPGGSLVVRRWSRGSGHIVLVGPAPWHGTTEGGDKGTGWSEGENYSVGVPRGRVRGEHSPGMGGLAQSWRSWGQKLTEV